MNLKAKTDIPRPEYPRMQMVRENWKNLNGDWEFSFDLSDSGAQRGMQHEPHFKEHITVPFCPESRLSGIGYTDFMDAVWYKKKLTFTEEQLKNRVLLNFEAVDNTTTVYCNGNKVTTHVGGYTPFTAELTDFLSIGENDITVQAQDHLRERLQPFGKQSDQYESYGCSYTRTTGIWQTVWLEFVPKTYITSYKADTFVKDKRVQLKVEIDHAETGGVLAEVIEKGEVICSESAHCCGKQANLSLTLPKVTLWEPSNPYLYDLRLTYTAEDGSCDTVTGYFGMRSIEWRTAPTGGIYLNGKPIFLRTVLDQGFYPDGIYTAPSDEDLKADILRSMALGFNGARLHQRVFEQRWLYHADRLGYLAFGEFANNSLMTNGNGIPEFMPQWLEAVHRDYNHPSIIGWVPFNESYWMNNVWTPIESVLYQVTKEADSYRPVIDSSGGIHVLTDMFDIHDYEQDPAALRKRLERMENEPDYFNNPINRAGAGLENQKRTNEPYWISECGGIFWKGGEKAEGIEFGYGKNPKTEEEFIERYTGLISAMLDCSEVCGFCYTQFTDIEQERNGLYHYDRSDKFSKKAYEAIRAANMKPSAFENKAAPLY